ncbi:hypothetical protein QBC44DRAFT_248111, partial [Cladorrhinum sp. PSN332]
ENIIRGHKAAINNPNVSKEAKENSRQLLGSYDESLASFGKTKSTKSASTGHKDPGNVARGLKATINNPKVSLEAKERAQEKLDHMPTHHHLNCVICLPFYYEPKPLTMSKTGFRYKDDKEGASLPKEAPTGIVDDSSYKTKGNESVPVVGDNARVEDPIDSKTADSDRQLEKDDKEAIDPKNIIEGTTHRKMPKGMYVEPGDQGFTMREP